jgi:hypothetical protein
VEIMLGEWLIMCDDLTCASDITQERVQRLRNMQHNRRA